MSSDVIQLIVMAGIAVFLFLKLRSVLGTREGFEKPPVANDPAEDASHTPKPIFDVIEGGPDEDITDHAQEGSPQAKALTAMKRVEPGFNVTEFLQGARGAYEMILMAFENGELDEVRGFLSDDVLGAFVDVIGDREDRGLSVEATFGGVRETTLVGAEFDRSTNTAEISVRLVGELSSVVKNADGEVIEGDSNTMKRQKDVWTFGREMGGNDPNWQLVATGG